MDTYAAPARDRTSDDVHASAIWRASIQRGRIVQWSFPYDVNPTRRRPVVTYALVIANVVIFLLSPVPWGWIDGSTVADLCAEQSFYQQWGAILRVADERPAPGSRGRPGPGRTRQCGLLPGAARLRQDAAVGRYVDVPAWRLAAPARKHALSVRLRQQRRRPHEPAALLFFYLATGAVSAYGYALANPGSTTTMVGASGAIAGVLRRVPRDLSTGAGLEPGAVLLLHPAPSPAWLVLGLWFVLQWFYSVGTGVTGGADVAYLAHVIGFVTGVLVGLLVGKPRPQPHRSLPYGYPPSPYER